MNDAAFAPLPHVKATAFEDREHRIVLTQYIRLESNEALAAGERRQMGEEARSDSASLIVLFDDERKLGRAFGVRRFARDVAPRSDDRLAARRFGRHDQRHFVHEVDVDRAIELGVGEIAAEAEEPGVDGVLLQQPERLQKKVAVCGPDRADGHVRAILQHLAHGVVAHLVHVLGAGFDPVSSKVQRRSTAKCRRRVVASIVLVSACAKLRVLPASVLDVRQSTLRV